MLKPTEKFWKLTRNKALTTSETGLPAERHTVIFRKSYPRFPSLPLPEYTPADDALTQLLEARSSVREFSNVPLSLEELSYLLKAVRIVDKSRIPEQRTYPSAGARFPIEIYVIAFCIDGLESSTIHHFNSNSYTLEYLWRLSDNGKTKSFLTDEVVNTGAAIVLTAALQRSETKYGYRAFPFSLIEAGHVAQNLLLAAAQLGLGACPIGEFIDSVVTHQLDLTGDEIPVYAIAFGKT